MSDQPNGRSQLWRVQVLPLGEIEYRGRTIAFTADYLAGLVRAFNQRVFDFVPFQVAGDHTSDPGRCRGEVIGLEPVADGLDVVIALTEEGAEVLRADPTLGAAPRIIQDYQRADGRAFPAVLQHVLGTPTPMITGLRPWRSVDS